MQYPDAPVMVFKGSEMETLKSGMLAYYDSFGGMIPVKVMSITGQSGEPRSSTKIRVRVTTDRRPYRRGEIVETCALWVVPRKSKHGTRIQSYSVQADQ